MRGSRRHGGARVSAIMAIRAGTNKRLAVFGAIPRGWVTLQGPEYGVEVVLISRRRSSLRGLFTRDESVGESPDPLGARDSSRAICRRRTAQATTQLILGISCGQAYLSARSLPLSLLAKAGGHRGRIRRASQGAWGFAAGQLDGYACVVARYVRPHTGWAGSSLGVRRCLGWRRNTEHDDLFRCRLLHEAVRRCLFRTGGPWSFFAPRTQVPLRGTRNSLPCWSSLRRTE